MVKYWIAGGLIDDLRDWEKEQDKGQTILNGLIDVCMLIKRSDNQVVMHDLIRDLAIGIIRKNPRFVVKAGMGIRESTGLKEFTEDVEKISLMRTEIDMLSGEPNCPKLSTLLLRENPLSGNISHEFFNHMNSLRVLDLSFNEIEYLPVSVSNLESLCALILKFCRRLREVTSLARLKHLRVLNLSNTGIKEVPDGMECLVNLKELHVSSTAAGTNRMNAVGCNSLVLPDSILKLNMHGCDLSGLRCLSRLQCLQTFSISWCGMKWLLPVGDGNTIMALPSIQSLFLEELPSIRNLCEGVLLPGSFTLLKFLRVSRCHVLENLMSLELSQHLQCLELIDIAECSEMEEVIQGEVMVEEGDNNNNITIVLPKLRWLYLCHLGKLRSICKRVIICPSLIKIRIEPCCRLKNIPLSLGHSTSVVEGNIKGSKEWWDALEWDDPNTRTLLLPAFEEEEDDEDEEEEDDDEEEEEREGHEGRGLKRKAEQELQHVGSTSRQRGSPH